MAREDQPKASTTGTSRPGAASPGADDINISTLSNEKIKQLMNSDPKFIGRLISQLDKQMHKMMAEKHWRQDQVAEDEAEIAALEEHEKTHVHPHVARLTADITYKTELKVRLAKEIETETANVRKLQQDAALVIQKARHQGSRLMRGAASQKLEETRGFSSTMPTTQLLGGKSKSPAA